MCRLSLLLPILLVIPLLASDSPKEYDGGMEAAGIEGTWRLVEGEVNGAKTKPGGQDEDALIIRSGTWRVDKKAADISWEGTYQIDKSHIRPILIFFPQMIPSKVKRSSGFTELMATHYGLHA